MSDQIDTILLNARPDGLAQAGDILARGGLVAFPTETVYGLGADACDDMAVARIFEAKGRPQFNPLIVHVLDLTAARELAEFDDASLKLAEAFWPGPLTLVVPLKSGSALSDLVRAGLATVAIRCPAHPIARGILRAFGGPVAAPSANPSGRISPTQVDHVLAGLSGKIEAVVDGGACDVGVESTILTSHNGVHLLREGGLAAEDIEAVLGAELLRDTDPEMPQSPGQLLSHYAPIGAVRLNATTINKGEILLGFGDVQGAEINLSKTGDLVEAAARLFTCLHALDAMNAKQIAVSPIPNIGLGRAINDRLKRAAAPRD